MRVVLAGLAVRSGLIVMAGIRVLISSLLLSRLGVGVTTRGKVAGVSDGLIRGSLVVTGVGEISEAAFGAAVGVGSGLRLLVVEPGVAWSEQAASPKISKHTRPITSLRAKFKWFSSSFSHDIAHRSQILDHTL